MAMPTSGSIGLKYCQGGTPCSSICVATGYAGTASLSSMSTYAGKGAPHCMREFYGYVPAKAVNFCQYYYNGGDYSTTKSCSCTCTYTSSAMVFGECYCLCTGWNLCVNGGPGPACFHVTCNGVTVCCCVITGAQYCANGTFLRTVDYNDVIRIINMVCYGTPIGDDGRSQVCIAAIGNISGSFARGTTCINVCRNVEY